MILIRLSIAFLIMLSTSLFLSSNIENVGEGSGYQFLILNAGFGVLLFILSGRWYLVTRVKASQIVLLFFLAYFIANLIFDTGDLGIVKAATVGTTGGVFFALWLGYLLSFVISDIYLGIKKKRSLTDFASFLMVLYLGLVLFMAAQAFHGFLANVRNDLFLIAGQEGEYQRPGSFIFIQFMISTALIALFYIFVDKVNKLTFVMALVLHSITAIVFMLLAQLIGSNSAMASVGVFWVMLLSFLYIARRPGLKEGLVRIGIKPIVFGWIGRRIAIAAGASAVFFLLALLYMQRYTEIDFTIFRISGFGGGKSNSFDSRIEIFKSNFIEHLSYNPIFGNTQVEKITTGTGSYTHSLLSIATHLGIIGFMIFALFVFQMYREIIQQNVLYDTLHSDRVYSLFRLFSLGLVLLFALLTAFYTWMPLWFAIGFFGIGLCRANGGIK